MQQWQQCWWFKSGVPRGVPESCLVAHWRRMLWIVFSVLALILFIPPTGRRSNFRGRRFWHLKMCAKTLAVLNVNNGIWFRICSFLWWGWTDVCFFCMCWLCGRFQDSTRWYVMIVGCNFMRLFILRRPREMYEAVKEKNTKCKWERSVAVACGVVVNIYTFTFGFALKLFLVDCHIPGIYRTLILWKSIFCTVLSLKSL